MMDNLNLVMIRLATEDNPNHDVIGLSSSDVLMLSGIEGTASCFVAKDSSEPTIKLALCKLDFSPKENWIEKKGGLPRYIHEIACSLVQEQGFTVSRAIATAISRCKVWAAGGGNVKPDTQAKAASAIAQWEKMKA